MNTALPAQTLWPLWKKILFRFSFIYLALQIAPWLWLGKIPGGYFLVTPFKALMDAAVNFSNAHIFHVKKVLVPTNGSGDTSYSWAQLLMIVLIAVAGCIIWSLADRKKGNYTRLNYWLCLFVRYYIALTAFTYGIIKIFGFQMHFPHLYEMAIPLGDLTPMQLAWLFIGYSTHYQAFAGVMEVISGSLLLYRRTATLGVLLATTVFTNVMMLNLCYDIDVKLFSIQLVLTCLYLLVNESDRIICFFILNKPAATCSIYHFNYTKEWIPVRIMLKSVFILVVIVVPFLNCLTVVMSRPSLLAAPKKAIKDGLYNVTEYSLNKHNGPISATDTLHWEDLILDGGTGSIKTRDTVFAHWLNRAYFDYKIDSINHTMTFIRGDKVILNMQYALPAADSIKLWGKRGNDSLFIGLKKSKHQFKLTGKPFYWLTEHEGDH